MSRETPVLDRLQTHASAEELREWLRLVADLSIAWIEAETAEAIVGQATSRLAATLGIDLSLAYWVLPGGGLRLIDATGVPDEVLRGIPAGAASAHAAALRRVPVVGGEGADALSFFLRESGRDAYVCYPLLSANHLTGTISFGRQGPGFSEGERALLDLIANQLSIVLERWRLRAQQEEAAAELRRRAAFKQRLLDRLPGSSLAVIDRTFCYGLVTSSGFHSAGHDSAWASGRSVGEVHDDATARLLVRAYAGAFEGQTISFNLVWQQRYYTLTAAPLDRDAAGISTIVALAHDETDRIAQERALARSEERAAAAADAQAHHEQLLRRLAMAASAMVSGFEILRLSPATERLDAARAREHLTCRLEHLARAMADQLPPVKEG